MISVYYTSMLIEKYNYKLLTRESINNQRIYLTPDMNKVPSVTTILGATKSEESTKALDTWRARVGEETAKSITTEAANVGTAMHNLLENWVKEIEHDPGNNMLFRQAKKMANVIIVNIKDNLTEVWGSEVSLYYPGLYAGTADLVGLYKGNPAIMDFKQTNRPKKEEWVEDYYMQLVAYALAHNEIYNTDIREGHIFMCSRDLQYQQFSLTPETFDYWAEKWAKRVDQFYKNNK